MEEIKKSEEKINPVLIEKEQVIELDFPDKEVLASPEAIEKRHSQLM